MNTITKWSLCEVAVWQWFVDREMPRDRNTVLPWLSSEILRKTQLIALGSKDIPSIYLREIADDIEAIINVLGCLIDDRARRIAARSVKMMRRRQIKN